VRWRAWCERFARLALTVTVVLFAAVAAQLETHAGGPTADRIFNNWLYDCVGICAGLTCIARGLLTKERAAWILVGVGVFSWSAGDIYWTAALETAKNPPFPSLADAGYLGLYLPVYLGLGMLIRRRVIHFSASVWLDGLIAACAVSAVASGIVLAQVWHTSTGDFAAVATNMAYPVGDALLLSLVIAAFAFSGWSIDRTWLLLGAGLAVFGVADSIYLVQVADGTYKVGTTLDLGWPAGFALIAVAASTHAHRAATRSRLEGRRVLVAPLVLASVCLGLEIWDHFQRIGAIALVAASIGLAAVIARLTLTFNEHLDLLRTTRTESLTDSLTGLSNRRALLLRLEDAFAGPAPANKLLLLFDLDGFKAYNDTFGHSAGDMLLSRLGARLRRSIDERGEAFRLGGDEFCILLDGDLIDLDWVRATTMASLREGGEGFTITCSSGHALIPSEAGDPSEALQIADRRMYADKGIRVVARDSSGVLIQALIERDRYLGDHVRSVVDYAIALAHHAGLRGSDAELVRAAAELHDVGKLALPESILMKPGALDEDDWRLIRQHTLVGERIIAAADGLGEVAATVRSTHERWDGKGYPDGLAGDKIPFSARLIAICDAYEAMTAIRPYAPALTPQEAVDELVRNAGTQFDPTLVELFVRHVLRGAPPVSRMQTRSAATG
jgi:two-component system, cell cycle response regulator